MNVEDQIRRLADAIRDEASSRRSEFILIRNKLDDIQNAMSTQPAEVAMLLAPRAKDRLRLRGLINTTGGGDSIKPSPPQNIKFELTKSIVTSSWFAAGIAVVVSHALRTLIYILTTR